MSGSRGQRKKGVTWPAWGKHGKVVLELRVKDLVLG